MRGRSFWISLLLVVPPLAFVPLIGSAYAISLLLFLFMYIALASSWNLISGFTGYVSFGHVSFYGVGAYTTAILLSRYDPPIPLALLLSGAAAVLLALLIGFPCLRLKGPYFAIVTLGLNELVRVIALTWESLTKGGTGISLAPPKSVSYPYYAMGIVAILTILTSYYVAHSKFGLRLLAIREDEVAAETMGINTTREKLWAFMLSALFPGIVGGVYAWYVSFIEPVSSFSVLITIQMIIMAMFGGRATVAGPVLGATILFLMGELVWAQFPFLHLAIFGSLILIVVLFMPRGIMGLLEARGLFKPQRIRVTVGKMERSPSGTSS